MARTSTTGGGFQGDIAATRPPQIAAATVSSRSGGFGRIFLKFLRSFAAGTRLWLDGRSQWTKGPLPEASPCCHRPERLEDSAKIGYTVSVAIDQETFTFFYENVSLPGKHLLLRPSVFDFVGDAQNRFAWRFRSSNWAPDHEIVSTGVYCFGRSHKAPLVTRL
jgi:hypothetical protein